MQFVILTQYYPPETGAPQNRLSDLARRLRDNGHSVTVLTAKPNYPQGRFMPGFERRLWRISIEESITVIRCWLFVSRSKHLLARLLNYLTFAAIAAVVGAIVLGKSDYVIVESPPIFLGLTGRFLAWVTGARMIFNVSDLYPETAVRLGLLTNRFAVGVLKRIEAWCYCGSALVTGQTEGICANIQARFPSVQVHLLTNGIDAADFQKLTKAWVNGFVVGYAGIHGYAQGLEKVIEAAYWLRATDGIHFVLYGDGPTREHLIRRATALGLTNVDFPGSVPRLEVLDNMRHWSAGIVPLVNDPLMAGAIPSKLFEVMASETAVVLAAPDGEATRIVQRAEGGICVPADDGIALARAIVDLAADSCRCKTLGRNGREFVFAHYDRERIANAFLARLRGVA